MYIIHRILKQAMYNYSFEPKLKILLGPGSFISCPESVYYRDRGLNSQPVLWKFSNKNHNHNTKSIIFIRIWFFILGCALASWILQMACERGGWWRRSVYTRKGSRKCVSEPWGDVCASKCVCCCFDIWRSSLDIPNNVRGGCAIITWGARRLSGDDNLLCVAAGNNKC